MTISSSTQRTDRIRLAVALLAVCVACGLGGAPVQAASTRIRDIQGSSHASPLAAPGRGRFAAGS